MASAKDSAGGSTRSTVPQTLTNHSSEPLPKRDVVTDDGLQLLEEMKRKRPSQLRPNAISGTDVLRTNNYEHCDLDTRLRRERIVCQGDEDKSFIPHDKLDEIICHDTIESDLSSMLSGITPDQLQEIITYVCGSRDRPKEPPMGKRIFACLVLIGKVGAVTLFRDDSISDRDLPLEKLELEGSTFKFRRERDDNSELRCFEDWPSRDLESFDRHQWLVKPPFFSQEIVSHPLHYELSRECCLPWVEYGENIQPTDDSAVRRVVIHSAQHNLQPEEKGTSSFALKTVKTKRIEEFRPEVIALRKLRPHPNLPTLLATMHYKDDHHLLFPWADGGDLLKFWKREEKPPHMDLNRMLWFAEQCFGLSEALCCIHNARMPLSELPLAVPHEVERSNIMSNNDEKDCGRHGDIKPQNILWFTREQNVRGYGVLKISDFGVTMFHREITTKVLPQRVPGVSQSYAAPEYEVGPNVSRPYDIWSLGCIFLEVITWTLLGFQGVQEFREARKGKLDLWGTIRSDDFYQKSKKSLIKELVAGKSIARVKSSVTKWIEYLLKQSGHSQYLSEFLKYIKKHMILAVARDRDNCDEVKDKLQSMLRDCGESTEYCLEDSNSG